MFNNIGGKIKTLAKVMCWLGIAIYAVTALVMLAAAFTTGLYLLLLFAVLVFVLGFLVSWIGSFFMVGFGEMIEKLDQIERNTHPKTPQAPVPTHHVNYAPVNPNPAVRKQDTAQLPNMGNRL